MITRQICRQDNNSMLKIEVGDNFTVRSRISALLLAVLAHQIGGDESSERPRRSRKSSGSNPYPKLTGFIPGNMFAWLNRFWAVALTALLKGETWNVKCACCTSHVPRLQNVVIFWSVTACCRLLFQCHHIGNQIIDLASLQIGGECLGHHTRRKSFNEMSIRIYNGFSQIVLGAHAIFIGPSTIR